MPLGMLAFRLDGCYGGVLPLVNTDWMSRTSSRFSTDAEMSEKNPRCGMTPRRAAGSSLPYQRR